MAWVAVPVFMASTATAQLGKLRPKDRKETVSAAEKQKERTEKSDAKTELRYEKIKAYATDKYKADPDFRDEVDLAYNEVMIDHGLRAYRRNIGDGSNQDDTSGVLRVHGGLYNNPAALNYVNSIGRLIAPRDSPRLYVFHILPDPIPLAETLATGTISVSTGALSLISSDSQLAYLLAHEIAHVYLDHWKERVIMDRGQVAYYALQREKQGRLALLGAVAGAGLGGAVGQSSGSTGNGATLRLDSEAIRFELSGLALRPLILSWDGLEEDAADEFALRRLAETGYDPHQACDFLGNLGSAVQRDIRVGLGYLGERRRIERRSATCGAVVAKMAKPASEGSFRDGKDSTRGSALAELQRDNGILAYYSDMYELAYKNLAEALAVRGSDSLAHEFYSRIAASWHGKNHRGKAPGLAFSKAHGVALRAVPSPKWRNQPAKGNLVITFTASDHDI
jgi:hypothetical protein